MCVGTPLLLPKALEVTYLVLRSNHRVLIGGEQLTYAIGGLAHCLAIGGNRKCSACIRGGHPNYHASVGSNAANCLSIELSFSRYRGRLSSTYDCMRCV